MKLRMARGRRRLVEDGGSPHKLKFGLMRTARAHFVPHPERRPAVEEIFGRYLRGVSRARIARDLTGRFPTPGDCYMIDAGQADPMRKSRWTTGMVREVIRSTIYAGALIDGRTRVQLDEQSRKVGVKPTARDKWTRGTASHSRIIDDRTFIDANLRLRMERQMFHLLRKGEHVARSRAATASSFLFHNKIVCALCGARAIFQHRRRRDWVSVRCEHA